MVDTHAVFHGKHSVQKENIYHWLFPSVSWYVLIFLNEIFLKYHLLHQQSCLFPPALWRQLAERTVRICVTSHF